MANISGQGGVPGVWAIPNYFSIERIDEGYYIRKFLGYDGSIIEWKGSTKQIAKQLIASLKDKHSERTAGVTVNYSLHTFHIQPFTIYLPELECGLDDDIKNDQKIDIDDVEIEISNEMKKLKHLLIFL
jgi:hypothetical protein